MVVTVVVAGGAAHMSNAAVKIALDFSSAKVCFELNEFRVMRCAEGAGEFEKLDRLKKVGLSLAVLSDQQVDPR